VVVNKGALPLLFGMVEDEVTAVLGEPERRSKTSHGEAVFNYEGVTLNFAAVTGLLRVITLFPPARVRFLDQWIFEVEDLVASIAAMAPHDLHESRWEEIVVPPLGVVCSGFHKESDYGQMFSVYDSAQRCWDLAGYSKITYGGRGARGDA